jgi:hypothetical protein
VVITMSVMSPFTYANLSLYSHQVITILCDLQIFSCPMNKGVTRGCHDRTPDPHTSNVMMTFVVDLHRLEALRQRSPLA